VSPSKTLDDANEPLGWTLIEVVVAISIIGLLLGLSVPGVVASRESARRIWCQNNLKQIGLALHGYQDAFLSFPPGRIRSYDPRYAGPRPDCTSTIVDKSLHVFLLPFMEQEALFNAINQSLAIIGGENSTVHSVDVAALACPSDPMSGLPRNLSSGQLRLYGVPDPARMVFTSYAGSIGSLPVIAFALPNNGCAVPGILLSQCNGAFSDMPALRPAAVADGLSNTIFVAEKSTTIIGMLSDADPRISSKHGWYITGNWGDTLVTTLYPPNAHRKVAPGALTAWINSASSMHANGVNVLMGDGSVRFVKDSVRSWQSDPASGNPIGATLTPGGWWASVPLPGIWQALSTRSGGEVVGSDPY
jgi:prepilin-type processing-associated H-X9-DG protein